MAGKTKTVMNDDVLEDIEIVEDVKLVEDAPVVRVEYPKLSDIVWNLWVDGALGKFDIIYLDSLCGFDARGIWQGLSRIVRMGGYVIVPGSIWEGFCNDDRFEFEKDVDGERFYKRV